MNTNANTLAGLREMMPEVAKDIRLNLQSVLETGSLSDEQRWGVAVAAAIAARHPALRAAMLAEARARVSPGLLEDAKAAAVLMAMNNVYYRSRHMIGKPVYAEKPARLRMNRLAQPASSKLDLELFSLAVSAINGCEMCLRAHERSLLAEGASEEQVHDALRLAATVHAAAVALDMAES